MIKEFQGQFRFLSNFWPAPVALDEETFPTVEHAYQAAKTLDLEKRQQIKNCQTPGRAKIEGKRLKLRPDWEKVKIPIMEDLVRQKFENPELAEQLLETGTNLLIEGNWWHDNFWGSCSCERCKKSQKHNMLGVILMEIRQDLLDEK